MTTLDASLTRVQLGQKCRDLCYTWFSQYFLTNWNSNQCTCVANSSALSALATPALCSDSDVWRANMTANTRLDTLHALLTTEMRLNLQQIALRRPVQIGDPFALNITSNDRGHDNYRLSVSVDRSIQDPSAPSIPMQTYVGNSFALFEFTDPGVYWINVSAANIRNSSRAYTERVRVDVRPRDAQMGLSEAVLSVVQTPSNPFQVEVNATVSGGHPYSCLLDYGDQSYSSVIIDSIENLNVFELSHTYEFTGVFNVSILCSQEISPEAVSIILSMKEEIKSLIVFFLLISTIRFLICCYVQVVGTWQLIYVQNSAAYTDKKGGEIRLDLYEKLFVSRVSLLNQSDFVLRLPFAMATPGLTFSIYHVSSNDRLGQLIESTNQTQTDQNSNGDLNLIVRLATRKLTALSKINVAVRVHQLIVATYSIVVEDVFTDEWAPVITTAQSLLKLNETVTFRIKLKRKTSNALLRVDFGNEQPAAIYEIYATYATHLLIGPFSTHPHPNPNPNVLLFVYSQAEMNEAGNKFTTIEVNATYQDSPSLRYTLRATLANHVSRQEAVYNMKFKRNLPKFTLVASPSVLNESNVPVTYRLMPMGLIADGALEVNSISMTFDVNSSDAKQRMYRDYSFNESNSWSLVANVAATGHGYLTTVANLTNLVSWSLASVTIRVGTELNKASIVAFVLNPYVRVDEPLYVSLRVGEGNGYNVLVDFGDNFTMFIPWSYTDSFGMRQPVSAHFFTTVKPIILKHFDKSNFIFLRHVVTLN